MSVTIEDVQRLVAAGVINTDTGDQILAFEGARSRRRELPGVSEIAAYLGAAIAGAGIVVLIATNWGSLPTFVRMLVPAVAAVAALSAGLGFRGANRADFDRAASVAWLLASALIVVTVAVSGIEAGRAEADVALASALVAVPTALGFWWVSRTHVQLAGIAGAMLLLGMALTSRASGDWGFVVFGLSVTASGLLGFIATETGLLTPRVTARILSAAALTLGAIYAGLPPAHPIGELAALLVTVVLLVASIQLGVLAYTVFAVLTAFGGLVTAILRHIDSPTIAALALIVVGLAVLAAIAAISRYRPWRA